MHCYLFYTGSQNIEVSEMHNINIDINTAINNKFPFDKVKINAKAELEQIGNEVEIIIKAL